MVAFEPEWNNKILGTFFLFKGLSKHMTLIVKLYPYFFLIQKTKLKLLYNLEKTSHR